MSKANRPVIVILFFLFVAPGCEEPYKHPAARTRSSSKAKRTEAWQGFGCRKFDHRNPYDHEKIEVACEYAGSIHGLPRTRGTCEKLAALISDVSVPLHNCGDNMTCIQSVAKDIDMDGLPDCSKLPER